MGVNQVKILGKVPLNQLTKIRTKKESDKNIKSKVYKESEK